MIGAAAPKRTDVNRGGLGLFCRLAFTANKKESRERREGVSGGSDIPWYDSTDLTIRVLKSVAGVDRAGFCGENDESEEKWVGERSHSRTVSTLAQTRHDRRPMF